MGKNMRETYRRQTNDGIADVFRHLREGNLHYDNGKHNGAKSLKAERRVLEFLWRLTSKEVISDTTGMEPNQNQMNSIRKKQWLTQNRRKDDVSTLERQMTSYTYEVDWDQISVVATSCGIIVQDGDLIALPLLIFDRFVSADFRCHDGTEAFLTHRRANTDYAASMIKYGLLSVMPQCNVEYSQLEKLFLYGGNYSPQKKNNLMREQLLKYKEIDNEIKEEADNANPDWDKLNIITSLLTKYVSFYTVLIFVPAKKHGRMTYSFDVITYPDKQSRRQQLCKLGAGIRLRDIFSCQFLKKLAFTLCGFRWFDFERSWLRDSSFQIIEFAHDIRPSYVEDVGIPNGERSLLSENEILSSVHKSQPKDDGTEKICGWFIPRFRTVSRTILFMVTQIAFLCSYYGVVIMNSTQEGMHTDVTLRTIAMVQLGVSFFIADRDESATVTRMLQVPRYISLIVAVVDASMFICSFTGPNWGAKIVPWYWKSLFLVPFVLNIIFMSMLTIWFVLYFIARFHPYLEGRRSSIAGDNVRQ